jgi:hypothetical protein
MAPLKKAVTTRVCSMWFRNNCTTKLFTGQWCLEREITYFVIETVVLG